MVHNGIEYGMMQAYGEGFESSTTRDYDLDLAAVARVWQHGSVVRSWLLDLAGDAFEKEGNDLERSGLRRRTRARAAGRSSRPSTTTCPRRSSR